MFECAGKYHSEHYSSKKRDENPRSASWRHAYAASPWLSSRRRSAPLRGEGFPGSAADLVELRMLQDRRDRIRRETSTARRFAALCGDQWEPLQEQQLPARRSATEPRARGETTIILAVSAHSSPQSSARNGI